MSFLYNKAALLGGATIGAGKFMNKSRATYPDAYGDLMGGFKVAPNAMSATAADLTALGSEIYATAGLTNRQQVSLEYMIASGKATADQIYATLGAIYAIDSLRWTLKYKNVSNRELILERISTLRSTFNPPGADPESKSQRALYAKLSKMMHPKVRPRKNVLAWLKDPSSTYRRGPWSHSLPTAAWIRDPEKRQARAARIAQWRNGTGLDEWKKYYGPRGNHREAIGDLMAVAPLNPTIKREEGMDDGEE